MKPRYDEFFAFARERHAIALRRAADAPEPWTDDPILRRYRFTNVFRELDKTTVWFRENVRDPMRDIPEVLLATVLFRWFNRIASGEAIFSQSSLDDCLTAWKRFVVDGDAAHLRVALRAYCGSGPYVTGAYMIRSPTGMRKLDGMCSVAAHFATFKCHCGCGRSEWRCHAEDMLRSPGEWRLEGLWKWLREFDCQGDFLAYEVITDLRHTALLDRAPDILTWANPGPGALRGLSRIYGRQRSDPRRPKYLWMPATAKARLNEEMREVLRLSRQSRRHWPRKSGWPAWEMREVEHTLCEFDKYERVRLGEGVPRGRFR